MVMVLRASSHLNIYTQIHVVNPWGACTCVRDMVVVLCYVSVCVSATVLAVTYLVYTLKVRCY